MYLEMGQDLGLPGEEAWYLGLQGCTYQPKSLCGDEENRFQERLRVLDPAVHLCARAPSA